MQYRIVDFLKAGAVIVNPLIQNRAQYPFNMAAAKRFFQHFVNESFTFDGQVGSWFVLDGKEAFPRHSYATMMLFPHSYEEASQFEERHGRLPDPIGQLHLECGGTHQSPFVKVTQNTKR